MSIADEIRENAMGRLQEPGKISFNNVLNNQVRMIAMLSTAATRTSEFPDYFSSIMTHRTAIGALESLLVVQVEKSKEYQEVMAWAKKEEAKLCPFNEFLNRRYPSVVQRKEAMQYNKGEVQYNRYRAPLLFDIDTKKFQGLIKLMSKHKLLETETEQGNT